MSDIRRCDVCNTKFDFDKSGLQGPRGIVVCGDDCAEKSSNDRGREHIITDRAGKVKKTNITPGLKKFHS